MVDIVASGGSSSGKSGGFRWSESCSCWWLDSDWDG